MMLPILFRKLSSFSKNLTRKIIAGLFLSWDGVIESPDQWHFRYVNEEMAEAVGTGIAAADTLPLSRVAYQELAGYLGRQRQLLCGDSGLREQILFSVDVLSRLPGDPVAHRGTVSAILAILGTSSWSAAIATASTSPSSRLGRRRSRSLSRYYLNH